MTNKHVFSMFVVFFVLIAGTIILVDVEAATNTEETASNTLTPSFAYDAPAVGLKASCTVSQRGIDGGNPIWADVTITNTTSEVKPICWSPTESRFFVRKGPTLQELEITARMCTAYPKIREPILIKSAKEQRLQYVLYLPAKASLTFIVKLPEETFKGYIMFDPLPVSGVDHGWRKESIQDRFVLSELIEYTVPKRAK